jgi:hypothetical protein
VRGVTFALSVVPRDAKVVLTQRRGGSTT